MLFFGITMAVFALVFYTVAIWANVIFRGLESWMVALYGFGFACDVFGTMAMFSLRSGSSVSLHGVIGWLAMMLMLFLLFCFMIAYFEEGRTERRVRKIAVCAWAVWVLSFLSAFF